MLFSLEAPERVSRGKVKYTVSQMTRRVWACVCVFFGEGECVEIREQVRNKKKHVQE